MAEKFTVDIERLPKPCTDYYGFDFTDSSVREAGEPCPSAAILAAKRFDPHGAFLSFVIGHKLLISQTAMEVAVTFGKMDSYLASLVQDKYPKCFVANTGRVEMPLAEVVGKQVAYIARHAL